MNGEGLRPDQQPDCLKEREEELLSDFSFAPVVDSLLKAGRIGEASRLCEAGVKTHPYYATGHLLLGQTYLAADRLEEARTELEKTLELEGPTPALLDSLVVCYDELGLDELARDCQALSKELDPRPLTEDESEGEPEMVDERDDSQEPGSMEEHEPEDVTIGGSMEIDDVGSPEDALKELEALLEGAGPSLEGEEESAPPEPPPVAEEPEPAGAGGDDLSAAEPAVPAGDEKSEMWKKIMEQADTTTGEGIEGIEDLSSVVDEEGVEEPAPAEAEEEVGDIPAVIEIEEVGVEESLTVESDLPLEGISAYPADVAPVEGLEITTPGGGAEDMAGMAEEPSEPGPIELPEEEVETTAGEPELEESFTVEQEIPLTDAAAPDMEISEPVEAAAEEPETGGVEEALKALEEEMMAKSDTGKEDEPALVEEAPMTVEGIDLEQALEEITPDEEEAIGPETDVSAPIEEKAEGAELPFSASAAGASIQIGTMDDSIKVAIQAEILVGKGNIKEAIRFYEALQLWEPERVSYKERLEELRRIQHNE